MTRNGAASHKPRRKPGMKRVIAGLILLALSAMCGTTPFLLMLVNGQADQTTVSRHAQQVEQQKENTTRQELTDAQTYNQTLYEDGQQVIGEAVDPWGGGEDSLSSQDANYQQQLDSPKDGIMATIEYPRLGINLPIRHGTGEQTLIEGAGHLYGSSLPVGGRNTHSIISAHTGLADRLMFDKLSLRQGRVGDVFYIHVLGETLAYKVTSIQVIDPDDFTQFGIHTGKDEVSLLTCTPYGVNNKRLLVTGERATMPKPAPLPKDAPQDHTNIILIAWITGVWLAVILFTLTYLGIIKRRKGKKHHAHHAA